eukprot:gene9508-6675_t
MRQQREQRVMKEAREEEEGVAHRKTLHIMIYPYPTPRRLQMYITFYTKREFFFIDCLIAFV